MIYCLTYINDYLWHLILRGKEKKKKVKHLNTKFLPIFQMVGAIIIMIMIITMELEPKSWVILF